MEKRMKKVFYYILLFQLIFLPLYGEAAVKYYKKRNLIRKSLTWNYKGELSKQDAEKLPMYFKVTYKDKQVVRVEYPYYKGIPVVGPDGRPVKGKSVETYKDGKIQERKNFVGVNLHNFFKYHYDKEGKLRKEEFYKRRKYTDFRANPPKVVTQTKMIYSFIYYYKKGVIAKRACYDAQHNQPVGKWEFYDENGKLIKIIQYRLVPSGSKMKGIKESIIKLIRDKEGGVIVEERYDGEGEPLVKLYFNDKGLTVRRDDYFDKKLLRRYKFFYRENGTQKKSELWEGGRKTQEIVFGNDGKTILQRIEFDAKGKPIKEKKGKK